MNVFVEWAKKNVIVPRDEMLVVATSPSEIRQLDLEEFRYALHDKQDDSDGIPNLDIHAHNPGIQIAGVDLARVVEIINGYTITFEDGPYNVNITGGNSNVSDVVVKNQVGVNTANSAGLQDLKSMQSSSFNGVVTVDQVNGRAGTIYPLGTRSNPVSNFADARIIAFERNLDTILVLGMAVLNSGDDVSDMTVIGTNPMTTILVANMAAETTNVYIKNLYFTGILDGGTILRECVVGQMHYFNGFMENCALLSYTYEIYGIGTFLNCAAGATNDQAPILNLTNAQGLSMRGYDGNLRLENQHSNVPVQIGMNGLLEVADSMDTGSVTIYGDVYYEGEGTAPFQVIDCSTATKDENAEAVWSYKR